MDTRKNPEILPPRGELSRLFFINIGVFLFILFFQPFPLEQLAAENRLLYVTGFGFISFMLACIFLILLPIVISKKTSIIDWESGPPILLNISLLFLTSAAFAFYIRFVGNTPVTFYIMFKVVLICLLPLIIMIILYKNRSLERIIDTLRDQIISYHTRIQEYEKVNEDEKIDIVSNNKYENFSVKYKNIIYIKSADNYVVVHYLDDKVVEKKMIRNTLKNIATIISHHPYFVRCHRTSIVNIRQIEKSLKEYGGHFLKMNHVDEKIPVSRQYQIHLQEAILATK